MHRLFVTGIVWVQNKTTRLPIRAPELLGVRSNTCGIFFKLAKFRGHSDEYYKSDPE